MIKSLTYGRAPIAVPAFRIIAILEGNIHDEANRPGLTRAYELFEASFDEAADTASCNFPGHKGKLRKITAVLKKDGHDFFARAETRYGEGLLRYGHALADFEEPAVPFFGVEQRSYECFLELALPSDDPRILSLAEDIAGELGRARAIWSVMGMGFFLPPYKSSLVFLLGESVGRYRTGTGISPSIVMGCAGTARRTAGKRASNRAFPTSAGRNSSGASSGHASPASLAPSTRNPASPLKNSTMLFCSRRATSRSGATPTTIFPPTTPLLSICLPLPIRWKPARLSIWRRHL